MQSRHKIDVVQQDRSFFFILGYRNASELSNFCRVQFDFVSKAHRDFAVFHVKHPVSGHCHMAACSGVANPNLAGQFLAVIGQDLFHFVFALELCIAEAVKASYHPCGFVLHVHVMSQKMAKIIVI